MTLMTDPHRIADTAEAARTLPEGCAIIYRHFGKDDREAEASKLRQITLERRQQLLIGDDPELAIKIGADGVHFRRSASEATLDLWRRRCPEWILTMAAAKSDEIYTKDYRALDALFVSSIFPSQSHSAGLPIGRNKLSTICGALEIPIIALGGINAQTSQALIGTGAAGLAGIEGLIRRGS